MKPMKFKFRFLDDKGKPTGFLRSKGMIDPDRGLVLKQDVIPFAAIRHVQAFHNDLLVLALGVGTMGLSMPGRAGKLMSALAPATSAAHAEAHRLDLESRGLGGEYRTQRCQHCDATLDLSRMPETLSVYCRYCDRVTQEGVPAKMSSRFRCCDSCGYYARPRPFTEFYFYFLLIVYGFSLRKHEFCGVCMREKAWKMLGINAVFLLGVPVALVQLYRAYFGVPGASSLYPGLETANAHARRGNRDKADLLYENALAKTNNAPGVHYNRGLAAVRVRDHDGAILSFEESLGDCANYLPTYLKLRDLYASRGERERVRELDELWDAADAGVGSDTGVAAAAV